MTNQCSDIYECHCHVALDGVDYRNARERHRGGPDEAWVRGVLDAYRRAGIRYVRDGGDKWGASALARRLAGEYGIEYASPVFPIFRKGDYGAFIGVPYETVSDLRELVARVRAEGGGFVKMMGSGIMDFDRYGVITGFVPDRSELDELVRIAHGEGLPVMMHMNSADGILRAVDAGVDSIEHGNYADRRALAAMADAGCLWVPTISATVNLMGKGLFDEDALGKILEMQRTAILLGHSLGVTIACGSDAGASCVMHAEASLQEARRLSDLLGSWEPLRRGQEKLRSRFPG
ncbi:MAG: amidohydrolase family protein [Oscillospiraceae bacterium]|nr:amidohydrolase family protein [Oscillospiraceae bacterium]